MIRRKFNQIVLGKMCRQENFGNSNGTFYLAMIFFPCSSSCFGSFLSLFCLSLQSYAAQLKISILPPQFFFSVYVPSFNELKYEYSCAMLTASNLVANMLRETTAYKLLLIPLAYSSINYSIRFHFITLLTNAMRVFQDSSNQQK